MILTTTHRALLQRVADAGHRGLTLAPPDASDRDATAAFEREVDDLHALHAEEYVTRPATPNGTAVARDPAIHAGITEAGREALKR